jgi:hypothetical protein
MTHYYKNEREKTFYDEVNTILESYAIKASLQEVKKLCNIIQKTIIFNKKLVWDGSLKYIALATTVDRLIEIYVLRSKVYREMGYNNEFPEIIKGLNFDEHDINSAILYTTKEGVVRGTCRIIFDSSKKLPLDKNYSLDSMRNEDNHLAELSRLMIDSDTKGLSQEPKWLTKGAYLVMKYNKMTTLMSVMVEEHFRLYMKFGGFKIEDKVKSYGSLNKPFIITSWQIEKISPFFKRAFLAA